MLKKQQGFTLAELLIALALLGVIAAFTIPKVLQASGTQEASAKVRETVSTLEEAFNNLKVSNQLVNGESLYNNLFGGGAVPARTLINAAQNGVGANNAAGAPYDPAGPGGTIPNAAAHPCLTQAAAANGWVQLPNGVVISGLAGAVATNIVVPFPGNGSARASNLLICIDTNGRNAPNVLGTDIFLGNFNQYGAFRAANTNQDPAKAYFWGERVGADNFVVYDPAGAAIIGIGTAANRGGAASMLGS